MSAGLIRSFVDSRRSYLPLPVGTMLGLGMNNFVKMCFARGNAVPVLLVFGCSLNENDFHPPSSGGPGTFEGLLTFNERTAGYDLNGRIDETCTAVFAVSGVQSDIDCFGCDWAFELNSTCLLYTSPSPRD